MVDLPERRGLRHRLADTWGVSLARRVIVTTVVAAVIVLVAGGYMVMTQARKGIMQAKQEASATEAMSNLQRMQNQLNNTDLRTESLLERLGQLADETGSQPGQYSVIIEAAATIYLSGGVAPDSIPSTLRDQMTSEPDSVWVTPTSISYIDGRSEPGMAVGGFLVAPSGQRYPVYFLFPTTTEAETLLVLRGALLSTGGLLLVALGIVATLVTRQVTVPVRMASETASRIAEGDLDQRLVVRGRDELASLARSMNNMAGTLQTQIIQLEHLSQVQQQFVSDVSHELRTPMTTMRMASELLYEAREDFDPVSTRSSELLHGEIERFESMLTDLLEISRFDAGAAILNLDTVDLVDLVEDEVAAHQAVAEAVGSLVTVHTTGETTLDGDARRLSRIIRNLLGNAISHGEGRPIDVLIAGDDRVVSLAVRDHGVGFTPDQAEKVFLRFWRADASRNRIIGGSGLGLAISLEDARLHHGRLDAWGRPGQGAYFRLSLPRHECGSVDHDCLPACPDDVKEDPS